MAQARRRIGPWIIGLATLLAVAGAVFLALREPPVPVDLASATEGPMMVTIYDEGEARVRDVFIVSAPLTGRLLRVDLEPGDPVARNKTVVARMVPAEPGFLDARSRAQAQAQEQALAAQVTSSLARIEQAQAEQKLADLDLGRMQSLKARGFASQATLDAARMRHDRAEAALLEARSAAASARYQLSAARAALMGPSLADGGNTRGVAVTSPVSGTLLRVRQESEAMVASGTPLLEIGDPQAMEVVTDLLSTDAVGIAPGAAVEIDNWGGPRPLRGKVRNIEPSGFTKVSSLGVEEQRVNVHIDLVDPRATWERLGHGYRVVVRIERWGSPKVLRVPVSALFRQQNRWAVFTVSDGRARLTPVTIDHLNDEQAEVLKGLSAGDRVILHPGDKIVDGRRIMERDQ